MKKFTNQTGLMKRLSIALISLFLLSGCSGDEINKLLGNDDETKRYSVSGTIYATDNSAIDSDVNDPYAEYASNDDMGSAQHLPNPVVLGGYVNTDGYGEPGRFYDPLDPGIRGDTNDFYTALLTDNQAITLYIADYDDAIYGIDIDLFLYDEANDLVQSSEGVNAFESLTVPSSGTYFIEVRALRGASNYILTIGEPATEATRLDARLQDAFVPGEVIVSFQENMASTNDISRSLQDTQTYLGMKVKDYVPGTLQVLGFDAQTREQVFSALGIQTAVMDRQTNQAEDDVTQLKLDTLRVIQALNNRPDIRYAEPNYFRYPLFSPNDTHYTKQWHYPLINLPQAWDITQGSDEVVVAVIDTGILSNHPDIQGQLSAGGYDFISKPSISLDGDGIDPDPEDAGDDMQGGSSFHGTHVAGTIAAATNNATGVAGVAPNVKIMVLRVLGKGGGTSADIIEALKYAAGLENKSNTIPLKKADIINMSLGGASGSQAEQDTITAVRNQGVIIIAAAGNDFSSTPSYPAAYDGVVSVSAVDAAKTLAPYSNYGATIDVAAPGGNLSVDLDNDGYRDGVLSTSGDDTSEDIAYVYNFANGTSMASPHMAGVVALMKSVLPGLTPALLDMLLSGGNITQDIGTPGRDNQYGHGLIDAYKAVTAFNEGIPAALFVTPLTLNFGASLTELSIKAEQVGTDGESIVLEPPISAADWLSISADENVNENGIGTYTVTVDRIGLSNGPYYATLVFDSDHNDIEVPVAMEVGDLTAVGDSGFHYILLLDADDFSWVDQVEVSASNGVYPFSFTEVPSGRYIVFAGTDSDNDYYIGDSGEATGAFISLDQPSIITLKNHVSGINFSTSFNLKLPAAVSALNDHAFIPVKRLGIIDEFDKTHEME